MEILGDDLKRMTPDELPLAKLTGPQICYYIKHHKQDMYEFLRYSDKHYKLGDYHIHINRLSQRRIADLRLLMREYIDFYNFRNEAMWWDKEWTQLPPPLKKPRKPE